MDFSGLTGDNLLAEYDEAVLATREFESFLNDREVFIMSDAEQAEHKRLMERESALRDELLNRLL